MAESRIVDQFGNPIQKQTLTQEIADAQLTGVRSVWNHSSVASYLNPTRLADVLERAAHGDHHDFLTLSEEMEERDLHYGGVLGTRKRAVSGIAPEVEAGSESARDAEIAQAVRDQIVGRPCFGDTVDDCLDALGKGYSAIEVMWETSARQWHPATLKWRDPRFFQLCQVDGQTLKLISETAPMGDDLPAYKFIVHRPRLKSGLPIRGALGRLAAVVYLCKGVALADWMTFAELFGMPVRLGKYGNNATGPEIATLRAAVASIGSDAAAVVPDSMKIEFLDTGRASGGESLFERLCDFLDKQISKGVVGQTMTADDGSSQSQANVHNEVRKDILAADIRQLENTLNMQLIKPFVDFNYGPQKRYPRISFPLIEAEDIDALVNAVSTLVPLNLRVSEKVMLDKLGLPEPQQGETLLKAPTVEPATPDQTNNPTGAAASVGLNRDQPHADAEFLDYEDEINDWQQQLAPIVDPIQQLAERADSFDTFLSGIPQLLDDMDANTLVNQLAQATFKAYSKGDADD